MTAGRLGRRTRMLGVVLWTALAAAAMGIAAGQSDAASIHHYTFFESPSRNIGCVIIDASARCDIIKRSWSPPPRPSICPTIVDYGQGLVVQAAGRAHLVCAGDTSLDPKAPILAYGEQDARGALRCSSAFTGMTCRSTRSGHGFFISRQRYSLF